MEYDRSISESSLFGAGRIALESLGAGIGYAAFLAMVYAGVMYMTEGREAGSAIMYCTQNNLDFRLANFGGGHSLKTLTEMGIPEIKVRVPAERHRSAAEALIKQTFPYNPPANVKRDISVEVGPLLPKRVTVVEERPCSVVVSLPPRI